MSSLRVGSIALVATVGMVATAACVEPESDLELGDVEQEASEFQASEFQASEFQASEFQASEFQASEFQGASLGGAMLASGTSLYQDRAISVWRVLRTFPQRHEQRLPDRTCLWDATRTTFYGCTTVNLATTLSPLAGVTFNARFRRSDGTTFTRSVRIKNSIGSVKADTSNAMHPLAGHAALNWPFTPTTGCPVIQNGQGTCENPAGCRLNCDLWMYDLELIDGHGNPGRFCPAGEYAYAVPGTYAANGQHSPSSTEFWFVCPKGTIAKCMRWGYRSFGRSKMIDDEFQMTNELADLPGYHQSCVRAAMADYCKKGHSFTKNGTLVDIWDYDPGASNTFGFVPRTKSMVSGTTGGLLIESSFDPEGAREIEYLRYQEASSLGTLESVCPGRFNYRPDDDVGLDWDRAVGGWALEPVISIDSTTGCMHSEFTRGKWLSHHCSDCAFSVAQTPGLEYCTNASIAKGWDDACVQRALSLCRNPDGTPHSVYKPLTAHGECTTGAKLDRYATGCAMRVCKDPNNASCCTTQWTSACTAAAKSMCPAYTSNNLSYSFCPTSSLPPNGS